MRSLLLAATALFALAGAVTLQSSAANAVVCADGIERAACAGPRGAVVVKKPVVTCKWIWVNGVKVKRCV